jgi:NTE family protein
VSTTASAHPSAKIKPKPARGGIRAAAAALIAVLLAAAVAGAHQDAAAQQPQSQPQPQPHHPEPQPQPAAARPKVALVLSGGGARGLAHIGVLRVLEELRVPVDIVVGTSFGAIIGGAYAGGADVAELERLVLATNWGRVLQDRPQRDTLSVRRREDDTLVSSRLELGIGRDGIALPQGAFASGAVERLLRQLTPTVSLREVRQLPLVYRAVATDMLNGEMVIPVDVPLFTAMRASMAVPGAFAPITVDGRPLGDGGLVRNLPVDLARELGAEVVIAVNVGTPLGGPKVLTSAFGMAQQMIGILTEQNVQRSLRELTSRDVLVTPDLGNADFLSFDRAGPNIEAGAAAARAQSHRLQQWSVTAEAWAEHQRRRTQLHATLASSPPTAAAVRVQALDRTGRPLPAPIDPRLATGQPVTPGALSDAAEHVTREFGAERVEAVLVGEGASREVILLPISSALSSGRLRLGIDMSTDFSRSSEFTLSGLYTLGGRHSAGGEWRTLLRAGAANEVQTEWYRPLAAGSHWFVTARTGYRGEDVTLYDEALRAAVVVRSASAFASLALGRQLLDSGQVQLGVKHRRLRLRIAIPDLGEVSPIRDYSWFGNFSLDTLDSLGFPTRGHLFSVAGERYGPGQLDLRVEGLLAVSRGPWAGHVYAVSQRSSLSLTVPLALGGFLRMSGAVQDSLVGERLAFSRAVLARQVSTLPATLGGAIRVGLSLEAAQVRENPAETPAASPLRRAGSVFTVLETRFGPVYLGFGHTRQVGSSAYLFLGSVLLPAGIVR